jgi:hypothetical protein
MPPDTLSASAPPATRFVVKRLKWFQDYGGRVHRQPGEVVVASFATIDEASADRRRREEEVRKTVNPFACGPAVNHWTHLDEPRLRDWLMDHGVEPPAPGKDGSTPWATWWTKTRKKLSADKRAAVWEALDRVRFFAVAEEPVRPVGYAVMEINWEYNDEYYDADWDGGRLVKVYRSRERADAECARRNEKAREQWSFLDNRDFEGEEFDPDEDMPAFDMQYRLQRRRGLIGRNELGRGEGQFGTTAGVPFFEVIEVELEGLQ